MLLYHMVMQLQAALINTAEGATEDLTVVLSVQARSSLMWTLIFKASRPLHLKLQEEQLGCFSFIISW